MPATTPRLAAIALVLLPAAALPQEGLLQLPASFVLPNYDRVFVGVAEAHEAGAYLARTRGPAATWYDPAGMVTLGGTAISVNVRGIEAGFLSPSASFPTSAQITTLGVLPLFLSIVLGPDVLPWQDVRIGISGTEQTSWSALAWWGSTDATGHRTYVSEADLTSYILSGSVAWAVSPRLRLGASLGGSGTRLYESDHLSGLSTPGQESTLRTRLLSGLVFHAVPAIAVQWDPTPSVALGAIARAPGLRVWGNATLQAERQDTTATSSANTFVQTGRADFDFKVPLELQAGAALRGATFEVELDARFHASAGTYAMIDPGVPLEQVTSPPGGPPVQTPLEPIPYSGRAVLDLALGGSLDLPGAWRLHGGVYLSPSPVAPGSPYFRQTDLWGVRTGVSFEGERLSGSVGLGYETGLSSSSPGGGGVAASPVDGAVRVQHVALTIAAEYRR